MEGNNKTIAKNTLMLYMRAILMMGIGLYTSRIILKALGITDFGIYNAVGGIIAMFGFISSSLSNATSRFITIAIGRGDQSYTNRTYGNIKVMYYILCVVIVLFAETVGLWFLFNKMTIPADRMSAAFWVYQYSVLSSVVGFISVPYNSAIIAHERMSAFAYISLLDATLKLVICFLLQMSPYDKLIVYATLLFFVGVIDRIIYAVYCNKRFEEVHAPARIDKEQLREILTMSGWSLSGNLFWILNTQGVNLILNVFFGPVVNAARGIAMQVQGVMGQFVTNFQTAINPQITKSYANVEYDRMHSLLHLSSKFSYFLMLLMSVPVFIEAPIILKWWLGTIPDNTIVYLRIILLYSVFATLANPLWIAVLATGKLKKYQLWDNMVQALVLPISYIAFKYFHAASYWVFIILLVAEIVEIFVRVWVVLPLINHKYLDYIREVVIPLVLVSFVAPLVPLALSNYLSTNEVVEFFMISVISVLSSFLFIWLLGMKRSERGYFVEFLKKRYKK
jgi:Membrane protein involved in the export of O-antigen and teichoic acid